MSLASDMIKPSKLHFLTPGFPTATQPRNALQALDTLKALDLDGHEMEFVHSVYLKEDAANELAKKVKSLDLYMTAHGQYFVNLNAKEQEKQARSQQRMIHAATRAAQAGANSIVFHLGYYLGASPEQVYPIIKTKTKEVRQLLDDAGVNIMLRGETTGNPTQFGTLPELLQLSQELEGFMPCIDFSHMHARNNGGWNDSESFAKILSMVEDSLGKEGLSNMHLHLSGIAYGEKGEKHHLILEESDMQWQPLIEQLKAFNVKGALVTESPNIEEDTRLVKKYYTSL